MVCPTFTDNGLIKRCDFWSFHTNCPHCQKMMKIVEQFEVLKRELLKHPHNKICGWGHHWENADNLVQYCSICGKHLKPAPNVLESISRIAKRFKEQFLEKCDKHDFRVLFF